MPSPSRPDSSGVRAADTVLSVLETVAWAGVNGGEKLEQLAERKGSSGGADPVRLEPTVFGSAGQGCGDGGLERRRRLLWAKR